MHELYRGRLAPVAISSELYLFQFFCRHWFESWKEKNFASDFNQPYMGDPDNDPGSANAIYLGLDFKDYTNHIVSFVLDCTSQKGSDPFWKRGLTPFHRRMTVSR